MLFAYLADSFGIMHAYRLSAAAVISNSQNNCPDIFSTTFIYELFKLQKVHVTFERMIQQRMLRFFYWNVNSFRSGKFNIGTRHIKVSIADKDLTFSAEVTVKNPFSYYALMCRKYVFESGEVPLFLIASPEPAL